MRKNTFFLLLVVLGLLIAGCTLDPFEVPGIDAGNVGGINIAIDVDATDVVSKYSVLSASISIVNPLGSNQTTNWTVSSTNHHFDFNTSVAGIHTVTLKDYDSAGDTNITTTNINFTAGHNYKLTVRLGADLLQYGIYAETVPLGVNWGTPNVALDNWDGSTAIAEETNVAGEGSLSYRMTGGSAGWLGVSFRVNPLTSYKDMHSYRDGSLRFMFKGTKPVRVGIQDGAGVQRWVYSADVFKFGLVTNDTWCSVVIPFTNFATNMNFYQIANYFTIIGEVGTINGTVYRFDRIYWSSRTN